MNMSGLFMSGVPSRGKSFFAECLEKENRVFLGLGIDKITSYEKVNTLMSFLKKESTPLILHINAFPVTSDNHKKVLCYLEYMLTIGIEEGDISAEINPASLPSLPIPFPRSIKKRLSFSDIKQRYLFSSSKDEQLFYSSLLENTNQSP